MLNKFERHLLDNFDSLYQTEINGMKWEDCCDYEEVDGELLPTWFFFTNDKYYIEGNYDIKEYDVYKKVAGYTGYEKPIKTFRSLRGAMNWCNNN